MMWTKVDSWHHTAGLSVCFHSGWVSKTWTHGLLSTGHTVTVQIPVRRPQGVCLEGPPRDQDLYKGGGRSRDMWRKRGVKGWRHKQRKKRGGRRRRIQRNRRKGKNRTREEREKNVNKDKKEVKVEGDRARERKDWLEVQNEDVKTTLEK